MNICIVLITNNRWFPIFKLRRNNTDIRTIFLYILVKSKKFNLFVNKMNLIKCLLWLNYYKAKEHVEYNAL